MPAIRLPVNQPESQHRAVCPYCGVGCQVVATVKNNHITQVATDKQIAPNFGMLCQKGALLKSPEIWDKKRRLQHPMIRPHRDAPHQRVTWDEAAEFVAQKIKTIQRDHGNDAVAFYGSGQLDTEASYLFTKLFKGYLGSNNMDTNSRLCMSSAVSGYVQAFGSDGPPTCYDDIWHADVLLIIGSNMAINHPVLFNMVMAQRRRWPNARIVVIDPRKTKTAQDADYHVPLAPGSDVAFLQLISKRLLEMGHADTSFVDHHTEGWTAHCAQLNRLDDAALLATCGLQPNLVDQVVQLFAKPHRLLSFYCQGTNQSTRGVDKNAALINLHLQLGQISQRGAGPFSLTGQPNAMGGREVGYLSHQLPGYRSVINPKHRAQVTAAWGVAPGSIHPHAGLSAVPMFEAAANGKIKALWTAGTNPAASMPNTRQVKAALRKTELMIHQDCYNHSETGEFADVLLPAAQWGEKTGTTTNSERLVTRSEKMIAPPGQAMPDWWIVARMGQALGFSGFNYVTSHQIWDEYRALTKGQPCDQFGMLNERLAQGSLRWPCPHKRHPGQSRLYSKGRFATASGKALFHPVVYQPPQEQTCNTYPLGLTTGRIATQWHTRTRTGKIPELASQEPSPFVEIHPDDAAKYRVTHGQMVCVRSRRGRTRAMARVTDTIRCGVLFMPFHWGDAFAPDSNPNYVTNPAYDPSSKQPELKFAAVRLDPAAPETV